MYTLPPQRAGAIGMNERTLNESLDDAGVVNGLNERARYICLSLARIVLLYIVRALTTGGMVG
jgi:hypothetical protein